MAAAYDAIVLGLGGMGSAALYHLARRGLRVLGIEQFGIAHDRGSSHGDTRIIRRAYFEHPDYVPLVDLSYAGWAELEHDTGARLFERTGLLLAGPADGPIIAGTLRAAAEHRLRIEPLTLRESGARFPALRLDEGAEVLFEPDAGFVRVEECVRAYVSQARGYGAEVMTDCAVLGWSVDGERCTLRVTAGSLRTFEARRLVFCAGAWSAKLLADVQLPLAVRRKPVLWYGIRDSGLRLENGFPVFGVESAGHFFYGFPSLDGRTMKVADHTGGEVVPDPGGVDRSLRTQDTADLSRFTARHLPGITGAIARHSVCMYTMTPDEHFIVDRHPGHSNVCFAAGFSGHGFKFAPVIGSALADLATEQAPPPTMNFLTLARFGSTFA